MSREAWSAAVKRKGSSCIVVTRRRALGAHWRAGVLRTNLWLVPGIEVVAAIALGVSTFTDPSMNTLQNAGPEAGAIAEVYRRAGP